jgi:hypothetical protein
MEKPYTEKLEGVGAVYKNPTLSLIILGFAVNAIGSIL